jgi:hypothetical protein
MNKETEFICAINLDKNDEQCKSAKRISKVPFCSLCPDDLQINYEHQIQTELVPLRLMKHPAYSGCLEQPINFKKHDTE